MSEPVSPNPYAPTSSLAPAADAGFSGPVPRRVSTLTVCLSTIGACTVAGSLFGLTMFCVLVAWALVVDGTPSGESIWDFGLYVTMITIAGALLALISSVPTVLMVWFFGLPFRPHDHVWRRRGIGRFALMCGLIAGFLPFTVISSFDPWGSLFSLLPALFGALVTRLLMIPLTRRAGDQVEPLSDEPSSIYAL